MSVSIVARRYAQAMLELGVESGQLDRIVEEVTAIADAWIESAELRGAIENPLVPHAAKTAVISDLAANLGAGPITTNTVRLLVDRRRAKALPYVARALRILADARSGLVRAEVTTVVPLPEPYYGRLQAQLEKMTGMRVVVDRKTDPSLIGGVVARLGDRVFDASLRTRLQSLRDVMMPNGAT